MTTHETHGESIGHGMGQEQPDLSAAFESSKQYLETIAARSIDSQLRVKISTSDLVQQTYLEAHRDFDSFQGETAEQLQAWLRTILLNNIANSRRRFYTDKRNLNRESVSLSTGTSNLPSRDKTPSTHVLHNEEIALLDLAMQRLIEDYRFVIVKRNLERKTFVEIGQNFGRSDDATRKLWFRAMRQLRVELECVMQMQDSDSRLD